LRQSSIDAKNATSANIIFISERKKQMKRLKTSKKILALFLTLTLVVGIAPPLVFAEEGDPSTIIAGLKEMAAELVAEFEDNLADVYELMDAGEFLVPSDEISAVADDSIGISDRAGLMNINSNLSGTYHLTADIDLSGVNWVPIGTQSTPFNGVFDGQGHTIGNMTITGNSYTDSGLFGYVSDATIKNVGLIGTHINVSSTYTGGIVGRAEPASTLTIENCYNTGAVLSYSSVYSYAGGIVGYAQSNSTLKIKDCYNAGDISLSFFSSAHQAGGIVGHAYASSTLTIENCYNTGDVSVTSYSTCYVGGIVGYACSSSSTLTIENCYNTGDVSLELANYNSSYTGGIVGSAESSFSTITIENCYNTGKVTSYSCVGGIGGQVISTKSSVTISNCYNMGDVSSYNSSANASTTSYAGGIVGTVSASNSIVQILNCYNTGDVSASSFYYSATNYAGGIVGSAFASTITINYCYNSGDVSATALAIPSSYAGGIVGMISASNSIVQISNCYNKGDVTSSSNTNNISQSNSYAGGIVGGATPSFSSSLTMTIENCYNIGDVSSSNSYYSNNLDTNYDYYSNSSAGGIVGGASSYKSILTITIGNCSNNGDVSASSSSPDQYTNSSAGGIVGYASKTITDSSLTITIEDCVVDSDSITATNAGSGSAYSYPIGYTSGNGTVTKTDNYVWQGIAGITEEEDKGAVYPFLKDPEAVVADEDALTWDTIKGGNTAQDSVTSNLVTLPTSGANNTVISWTSSSAAISNTGVVTRPAYGSGDVQVTLTATIAKGGASDEAVFELTVLKLPQTDSEAVAEDKAALTWDRIRNANAAQDSVTSILSLPDSGVNGTTITWDSDDAAGISDEGVVTRPAYGSGDVQVTLTATIVKGGASDKAVFELTVSQIPQTDAEAVAEDKATLTWDRIRNANAAQNNVTSNLNLPTSGASRTAISWTSNNAAISNTGVVTRPAYGSGDIQVTLTATIAKGDAKETVAFALTVKELSNAGGGSSGGSGGGGGGGGGGSSSSPSPSPSVSPSPSPSDEEKTDFEPEPAEWTNPFTDVKAGDWFYADVAFVCENGLFAGTSATTFSPNAPMTRGMIVTVLGRLYGANTYESSDFADVEPGKYYTSYVEWAKRRSIVSGVGGNKFTPDAELTRQDLAIIITRYADFARKKFPVTLQYAAFADDADIAEYAKNSVQTLYCSGIVSGKPGNLFDPKGSATRAEVAAILHRFIEAVK
jgi:hypothetical protein